MVDKALIPATPAEDDYARQVRDSERPAPLSGGDPIALFESWLREALKGEPNDANAMILATVDTEGAPDARMVLLKDVDARGFVFFTNLESAKGVQLTSHPEAALVFYWKSLRRSVRVRGDVARVDDAEADAYFATRARSAQIGAWASDQSRPMPDPLALERRIAEVALRFGLAKPPRPPHWSGFRLKPRTMEFWRDRPFRLHERVLFTRAGETWNTQRLFP
jgi:pyridoxamine 5'-phosphate oxidase